MAAHIGKNQTRIIITISKKQDNFLTNSAKALGISKSKFIRQLLRTNIGSIFNRAQMSEEELKTIIEIAKTPWLDDTDE